MKCMSSVLLLTISVVNNVGGSKTLVYLENVCLFLIDSKPHVFNMSHDVCMYIYLFIYFSPELCCCSATSPCQTLLAKSLSTPAPALKSCHNFTAIHHWNNFILLHEALCSLRQTEFRYKCLFNRACASLVCLIAVPQALSRPLWQHGSAFSTLTWFCSLARWLWSLLKMWSRMKALCQNCLVSKHSAGSDTRAHARTHTLPLLFDGCFRLTQMCVLCMLGRQIYISASCPVCQATPWAHACQVHHFNNYLTVSLLHYVLFRFNYGSTSGWRSLSPSFSPSHCMSITLGQFRNISQSSLVS